MLIFRDKLCCFGNKPSLLNVCGLVYDYMEQLPTPFLKAGNKVTEKNNNFCTAFLFFDVGTGHVNDYIDKRKHWFAQNDCNDLKISMQPSTTYRGKPSHPIVLFL